VVTAICRKGGRRFCLRYQRRAAPRPGRSGCAASRA
jgi:hypothetical protein